MNSLDDLKNLHEFLRREVFDYAEFLMKKYEASRNGSTRKKWTDVNISDRGRLTRIDALETVISEQCGESRQNNKDIESLLSFADNISQKVKKLSFLHVMSVIVIRLSIIRRIGREI